MSPVVRRLVETDTPAYRALRLAGLHSDPKAFSSDLDTEAALPKDWFVKRLAANTVFGGFSQTGELIAAVGYERLDGVALGHRGHIWGMIVLAKARGHGVGRAVLSGLIDHALQAGVKQLHLGVGTYNTPAIALYQSLGFTNYGTEPRALFADGQFIDEHLMVLKLDKEDRYE